MDSDTAWHSFTKQAEINKAENQTSVDDKLDVILAQQQEIITDTSRVADLVPMVTGDKAEEDALDETGDLEGENPEGIPEEGVPEEGIPEEGQPMDGMEDQPEEGGDEMAEEGDNPFAFLDEDDAEVGGEGTEGADDYEETDEESDMVEGTPEESADVDDEDTEEPTEEEGEASQEEESSDEESKEGEPESDEGEPVEGEVISFDSIEDDDEEEEPAKETKKSRMPSPVNVASSTKTIKSIGARTPMTILKAVQKPTTDMSYGRASSAEEVTDMLLKASGHSDDDDFQIGYGVDPHKAVEKDWAEYRLLNRLGPNIL